MRLLITFIRRVLYACILLIAVLVLNFMLIHLAPGDPADVIAGEMGGATKEIQGRRGTIVDMTSEGDMTIIESSAPVSELFGFAGDIRSATEGRAMWSTEFAGFDTLPANMTNEVVSGIRERKGLKKDLPQASDFMSM